MSKDRQCAIKAVEKFRKNSEKEIERVRALQKKSGKLVALRESLPAIAQFIDRLQQKELQASGDLVWADQLIEQLGVSMASPPKAKKKKSKGADSTV